jgi:hypothetical protein
MTADATYFAVPSLAPAPPAARRSVGDRARADSGATKLGRALRAEILIAAQASLADALGATPEAGELRAIAAATARELHLTWLLPEANS